MLKKTILLAMILIVAFKVKAQDEVGGFLLGSLTGIYNDADKGINFYNNRLTFSRGAGVDYVHYFKGKKDTRKHSRYAYKLELTYQGHSQKRHGEYKAGKETIKFKSQERLDYIKFSPMFKISDPHSRQLSTVIFFGPQISYLIDYDGGLLSYQAGKTYDKFDKPEQSKDYYHRLVVGVAGGFGVEYEFTRWIKLTAGARADVGITNTDKPKEVNKANLYYVNEERGGSHNYSLSLYVGTQIKLHKPQYSKTRF